MAIPLRVLIVEDSSADAELMVLHLTKEGFQPDWQRVETEPDFMEALGTNPELILADWHLPQFSALRALQLMKERSLNIPFIIVSGSIGEETAIDALRQGADDYMLKDRPARLGPAVRHALEGKRLRQERQRAGEELSALSTRQEAILAAVPDILMEVDKDRVYTWANPGGLEFFGKDVIGKEAAFYFEGEQDTYGVVKPLFNGSEDVFYVESWQRRKDGEKRLLAWWCRVLKDTDGNVTGALSSAHDITERKRAEEVLRLRMEQLVAINQASLAVTTSLDLDQVLTEIMSLAGKVMTSDHASVVLVDNAGLMSSGSENLPSSLSIEKRARKRGFTNWIIHSHRPAVADEISEAGLIRPRVGGGAPRSANPHLVAMGIKSFVGLPLMVKDHIVGVLYLHSLRPGTFHDQLTLLTTFANQAAIAIEKARLYEEVQKELAERKQAEKIIQQNYDTQSSLNALLQLSLENIPLEDMLKRALDLVLSIPWLALELKGGIFLVGDEPDVLEMKAQNNLGEPIQRICARVPFGKCVCGRAALMQKIQFSNHLDEQHEIRYEGIQPHGHYCAPILFAGRTIGVINLYIREGHHQDQKEVEFLGAITNTLAGIIERKRAEQEIEALSRFPAENPNPILRVEQDGKIIYANLASEALLRLWNCTVGEYLPSDWRERVVNAARNSARTTVEVEWEERVYSIMVVPIPDSGYVNIYGRDITERQRAEETLRKSEKRFRALVEHSMEEISLVDPDGTLTFESPTSRRPLGYPPNSFVGHNLFDLFHPDERAAATRLLEQSVKHPGSVQEALFRLQHQDGSWRWMEGFLTNLLDEPAVQSVVINYRDISERKLAEAELQASREAERNFAERLTILSETTTELSKAESLDALCRRAVELGRERLDFDRLAIWFVTEDSTEILGTFGVDVQGRITDERGDHFPVRPSDDVWPVLQGQVPLLRITDTPLALKGHDVGQGTHVVAGLWDGNTVIGFVGIDNLLRQRPFSDRECEIIRLYASALGHLVSIKRAEDRLHDSEERYRLLFELSPDSIAVYQDGKVVFANPAAVNLMGATVPEEFIGKPVMDFVHPDYRKLVIERSRQMMTDGKIVPALEEKFLRVDGTVMDVDVTAAPVNYRNKSSTMVIFRDITERKLAEAELQASREAERNFAERLTTLSETTTELSKAESLDALCRGTVELGRGRLDFDRLAIWFIAEDRTTMLGTFGVDAEGRLTDERTDHHPLTPESNFWPVVQGQIPLLHLTDRPLYLEGQVVGQGSHVCAALWDGEVTIGYMSFDNLLRRRPFSDQDCEIIRLYASAVGHLVSLQRAQKEIHASEERFEKSFQSNPIATIINILPEGRMLDVNDTFLRITGYSREEVIGKTGLELGLWENPEDRIRLARALIAQESLRDVEGRLLTKSGESREILASVETIQIAGQPHGLIMLNDVTERKRAEEALRAERNLLRTLIDNLPDAIYAKDLRGRKTLVNRADLNNIGRPEAEVLGKTDAELFPSQIAAQDEAEDRVLQSGQPMLNYEEQLVNDKGKQIWLLTSKLPLIDAAGQVIGLVGIGHDITERKQTEEKMARQSEELLQRNTELARLYRASGSLISGVALSFQDLAQKIVDIVQQEFGQANCSLIVVEKDSNKLVRLVASGSYADQVRYLNLVLDGPGLVPLAIRSNRVVNVGDVRSAPDYVQGWDAAQSEMAIPLKAGSDVIGVIDMQSSEPDAFGPDDERLMTVFAERAALSLEHGRLNEQTETRLQQLASLRTVDMAISGSFDLNLTLGILLDQLTEQLGVHAADILVFNASMQTFEFTSERGFRTQMLHRTQFKFGAGYAWRAIRERRVVNIPDINVGPDGLQRSPDLSGEQFVAYLGVPLIAKGEIQGVLEVFHREPLVLEKELSGFLEMLAGQAAIAINNAELFNHLQNSNADLTMAYDTTLEGWASALELRDKETGGHTRRVTEVTMQLARAMGVKENELIHIYRGALLHDIGKMGVPDRIVLKPGPLTEDEWVIMRKHPQYAHDMLSPIIYLRQALDIPYCHHEKWDGTGYPRGLKGVQIPLAARIFAVVDVWDALNSDRPYRAAWPEEKVREHIRSLSGTHFEPRVVDVFNQILD